MPQRVDVVRVLHEPDVEHQVGLEGHAVLEAKADQLEDEFLAGRRVFQVGEDPLLELSQRQVRGVDDEVGVGPDGFEQAPLLGDRPGDAATARQRVPVARLREPTNQHVVAGFQEDDARLDAAAFEGAAHCREGERCVSGAYVENDCDLLEPLAVDRDQLGQVGQ